MDGTRERRRTKCANDLGLANFFVIATDQRQCWDKGRHDAVTTIKRTTLEQNGIDEKNSIRKNRRDLARQQA